VNDAASGRIDLCSQDEDANVSDEKQKVPV